MHLTVKGLKAFVSCTHSAMQITSLCCATAGAIWPTAASCDP